MRTESAGINAALVRQLGPFVVTALIAWAAVLIGTRVDWPEYVISLAVLFAAWTYGLRAGLRGRMLSGTVIGSYGFLLALGLMRDSAGGSVAAVTIVSLLPVFQTALYLRDRRGLWLVLAGLIVFYLAPLILIGPPRYPNNGYRGTALAIAVSSIVGLVTHRLVADIRRRASEGRHRERILQLVNSTVQELYRSVDPRHDACRAVQEASEALVVGLYEPEPTTRTLRMTTTTRTPDAVSAGAPARSGSIVYEAFQSGQPQLLVDDVEAHVGNVELWRADGAPSAAVPAPAQGR